MKATQKRLSLARQTLRTLTPVDLGHAGGGTLSSVVPTNQPIPLPQFPATTVVNLPTNGCNSQSKTTSWDSIIGCTH
jgi:hypothetical protein